MTLQVSLLRFIGSKWFTLTLLVAMCITLPITYNNLQVVRSAGMLGDFWYIAVVFVCNALAALLAFWKFMSMITDKSKPSVSQEW